MHVDGQTVCMMLNLRSRQVLCRPPELIDDESAPPSPVSRHLVTGSSSAAMPDWQAPLRGHAQHADA